MRKCSLLFYCTWSFLFYRCLDGFSNYHYAGINPACYPEGSRCDEWYDCQDGSDEYNCTCE